MGTNEIIGIVVLTGIPLVGSFIGIIKPIINLNKSITELSANIKQLSKDNASISKRLEGQEAVINDHEKRIYHIEHQND